MENLSRHKPKTVSKLFEIMQEYCISDRAKRRRLEEKNEAKKGPAVMIVTIAKSGTRKTEETTVAEERKPLLLFPWQGQRSLDKRVPLRH